MGSRRLTRITACSLAVVLLALAALAFAGCGRKEPEGADESAASTQAAERGSDTSPGRVTQPGEKTHPEPPADESARAVDAARADALRNNPGIGELNVLAVKMADGWARVDMQPADRSTDPASWLLTRENGTWRVVDFGTTLLPADHPDAPAAVFQ